jgi:formimidoylglutamate deiminase
MPSGLRWVSLRTACGCRSLHGRIQTAPRGSLEQNGLLDSGFTAVHAIHVTSGEISALSRADATVCACPTTERNLGDGTVPADRYLSAGVPISLGSDSNVQINLLVDARELEYHLRMLQLERAVLSAKQLFHCASEAGARSLGAPSGSLDIGLSRTSSQWRSTTPHWLEPIRNPCGVGSSFPPNEAPCGTSW